MTPHQQTKKIVIVGASSLIAEHCARIWANKYRPEFVLVGRNLKKLQIISEDLQVRNSNSRIELVSLDFCTPASIQNTIKKIYDQGMVDIALIAHGTLPDQKKCEEDLSLTQNTLLINAVSPALFMEAFANQMVKANHGSLAIISSVAGDRGRKTNYVYGAAKGMLNRYAQGLEHRFSGTNVRISLIKPGPTNTPMTAHIKSKNTRFSNPVEIANNIVSGIESGKSIIYAPKKWWLIMMFIRHLPSFIFNRLNI